MAAHAEGRFVFLFHVCSFITGQMYLTLNNTLMAKFKCSLKDMEHVQIMMIQ